MLRILIAQGWYIGIPLPPDLLLTFFFSVCYSLGIYLLNLFLAFLTPKFDPSLEQELADQDSEEGVSGGLPTKQDDEFRPFIRRCVTFSGVHAYC